VMPLIREAIDGRAYVALGYPSQTAYVSDRFGGALSRLGVDVRREVVRELTDAGMSTRAIGQVVGVSNKTVYQDRQAVTQVTPEPSKVTGMDGKQYSYRMTPVAEPTPIRLPKIRTDVGPLGSMDRVASELLTLLDRTDPRDDPPDRRVLLGDLAAVIEERHGCWVE
jgi:hypothetical protein